MIIREFLSDRRGNIALMFGLLMIPMLGIVGAAIDYARGSNQVSRLQTAVDATTMNLAQTLPASTTASDLQTAADTAVRTYIKDAGVMNALAVTANRVNSTIQISASSRVSTPFVSILGFQNRPVSVTSTAEWGNTRLRVALVLDVTGSMSQNNKLPSMKTAATNLITQLQGAATTPGDVYVSVVPFSMDVNVGASNYNQSWVKFSGSTDTWDEKNGSCSDPSYSTSASCTGSGSCTGGSGWTQSACTSSGTCSDSSYYSKSSCQANGMCYKNNGQAQPNKTQANCGGIWKTNTWTQGSWSANTWTVPSHSTWNGCVMDRDQNYDTTNTAPGSNSATLFPAEQSDYCPAQLLPLSYDWTALKNKVNSLTAQGGTNQAIGLAHGYQTLTASPYTVPAKDPAYGYAQTIILLSDGLNTYDRWYGNGSTWSSQVDARQKILCDNIKAAGITIYTVQVNTSGDPTSSVLQYCASSSDKFTQLTSADQIVTTFQQIGTQLMGIRITH